MRVVVYGSRPDGHARVVIELFEDQFEIVGLLDDIAENSGRVIGRLTVLGAREDLPRLAADEIEGVLLGFGGTAGREPGLAAVRSAGLALPPCVHPAANVASSARIGDGSQALPGATIGPGCELGAAVLVNCGAIVSHDVRIEDAAVIDPGAVLGGRSAVGSGSEIGSGAVVLPDVRVGRDVRVGAGAVVTRDVPDGATVVGIPARQPEPR